MTRVAWIDASAGCAGDMLLGALVDAGLDFGVLADLASQLDLGDLTVSASAVERGAIAATKVDVRLGGRVIGGKEDTHATDSRHGHRHLADVLELLGRLGDLDTPPLADAVRAFQLLAEAEGRVHGCAAEAVHFHEVGAADALVDIAGTCVGLAALGVERVFVSPLPWNHGTVEAAHGTMPLPAPATAFLLRGHPVEPSAASFEQVTPTGAALVRTLAAGSQVPAGFVPDTIGHGAGTHPGEGLPNIVRIVIGHVPSDVGSDHAVLLETNLDDVTAQVVAHAIDRALAAGALDAWTTPVTMKKGRPGVVLSVLVAPTDVRSVETMLFLETPTLGIRRHVVSRTTLARHHVAVETPWGAVRMKVRATPGGAAATPEFEDCRRLAETRDVALARVLEAAVAAWTRR